MKKVLYSIAVIASALAMVSCGGSGNTQSKLFGEIPSVRIKYEQKSDELQQKMEDVKDIGDLTKLAEEYEALGDEQKVELEAAANKWSGSTLEIDECENLTVNTPITVEFDGFFSSDSPKFKINGDIVVSTEIECEASEDLIKYYSTRTDQLIPRRVRLIALDAEGNEVFKETIGTVKPTFVDNKILILVGEKVIMDGQELVFSDKNLDQYGNIEKLTLAVDKE